MTGLVVVDSHGSAVADAGHADDAGRLEEGAEQGGAIRPRRRRQRVRRPRPSGNLTVPVVTADEAVTWIADGDTVGILGAGGGLNEATSLIDALARRHRETGSPVGLTFVHSTGLGDRGDRGMSPLAQTGLCSRVIGGHWGQSPRLAELAERDQIEAYNFPQGVLSQLFRATAAGQPGILTHVGLGTFVDPRSTGGRLNAVTREELVRLIDIGGEPWLFYPALPVDVAFIRATTADTLGYLSFEDEVTTLDALALAQAAHNSGGLVVAQVQRVVRARTLHPKSVRVPGFLVDGLVVCPDQPQLYTGSVDRFFSGDYTMETTDPEPLPLDVRKVVARRALLEVTPGDVGNVGVGISDGVGVVAREEGVDETFTLTVELGPIGGISAQGIYLGATINAQAVVDMGAQFDFYDGGGLDIAFLSFAEVDRNGNVNVHRFGGKIMGTGGFIDIAQNSRKVVFSGTFTAGGADVRVEAGALRIAREGRIEKFVAHLDEVTFSAADALASGHDVRYVTERAVFRLTDDGLCLAEVAPGVDVERDIFAHMGFVPLVAEDLAEMDPRLFELAPLGLRQTWSAGRADVGPRR